MNSSSLPPTITIPPGYSFSLSFHSFSPSTATRSIVLTSAVCSHSCSVFFPYRVLIPTLCQLASGKVWLTQELEKNEKVEGREKSGFFFLSSFLVLGFQQRPHRIHGLNFNGTELPYFQLLLGDTGQGSLVSLSPLFVSCLFLFLFLLLPPASSPKPSVVLITLYF